MNSEQLHRDIGRVEGEVKALRRDVSAINVKLDAALTYIEQQKGARRAALALATGSGSVFGALAALAVSWFGK